jgi:hypothetical protein
MMSRDNGTFRHELGSGHALAQMIWQARSVLKGDPQKHDNAAAAGELVVTASVGGRLWPDGLQQGIELSRFKRNNRCCT